SLTAADYERLAVHLEELELPFRFKIEVARKPIEHIYFPEDGLISVVAHGGGGHDIEVGLIGFDGMSGAAVLLGAESSPNSLHMQIAGRGKRLPVKKFLEVMRECPRA